MFLSGLTPLEDTTQSRLEIKDPKIISQIKPCRETKPKAEAWQDPTYSEKFQKQPFKGQKGRLKAMFLTFWPLKKNFEKNLESSYKMCEEFEIIF